MDLRFHRGRDLDVFDELDQPNSCSSLDSGFQTDLRERAVGETPDGHEAATEDPACATGDSDVSRPQHLIREQGGRHRVAQLVCQETQALEFLSRGGLLTLARVLRDSLGDRVVEASVQRVKFF